MKKISLLGLSAVLLLATTAHAGLYRWVDDSGKVHYSDKMPVAASKKAHTEIAGRGLVKKDIDPQAAIDAANQKKQALSLQAIEELRQKQIEKKKREKLAELEKRDNFLMLTYENENELKQYFERKIKLLKGNADSMIAQRNALKTKLKKLIIKKSKTKDTANLTAIEKKIVRINNSIKKYQVALKTNKQELFELDEKYQHDMKRFIELTQKAKN